MRGKHHYMRHIYIQFFITFLTAAFVVNGTLLVYYSVRERRLIYQEKERLLEQTVFYADRIMEEADTIGGAIWTSNEVQNLLKSRPLKPDYLLYRDCMEYLSNFVHSVNSIYRVDLYIAGANHLVTSGEGVFYNLAEGYAQYYRRCLEETDKVRWVLDYQDHRLPYIKRSYNVVTLMRPVFSNYSGAKAGVLCIELPISEFYNLIDLGGAESEGFVIAGEGGKFLTGTVHDSLEKEVWIGSQGILNSPGFAEDSILEYRQGKNRYRAISRTSHYSGWNFYSYYKDRILIPGFLPVFSCMVMVMLLFGSVFYMIIRISRKKMSEPVGVLLNAMKDVEGGQFGVQIEERRDDAFGTIYNGFNHMTTRIQKLIDELVQEQNRRKEFKYRLLQSQINPHFLYNIFNNMIWMLEQTDYAGLEQMIYATAGYYKMTLNYGNKAICLSDNLKQLQYYVQIQKVRFAEKFTCAIKFDEDILSLCIPNLLLQPLLENAINHGARNREGMTDIRVTGCRGNAMLYFEVWDNGAGIPGDVLEDIRRASQDDNDDGKKYFALVNIARRLRLKYHGNAQMHIDSEYGSWTRVRLQIPEDMNV